MEMERTGNLGYDKTLVSITETNFNPIQLYYTNTSDDVKNVNAFEIFNSNQEGIEVKISGGVSMEYLKKYFYENPHLSSLIRIQGSSLMGIQSEKAIYLVNKDPMGRSYHEPAIIPMDCYSKFQFQSGIIDIPYSFVLDGLSNDLEFDLCPNTTICLTVFFTNKCVSRTKESLEELIRLCYDANDKRSDLKYVASFTVENTSDEAKEIILLDLDKYEEYSKDENIKIGSIFGRDYLDVCSSKIYFNSVRIFSTGENKLKQISQPIQFNSGNNYYPAKEVDGKQFQYGINDLNIIGEEFSCENPMKITVMPKTRVVYLFKTIKNLKPTTTDSSFINICVENPIDETRKVDILSYYGNDKEKKLIHLIGKNKLSFNIDNFQFDTMRIQFYNKERVENPILIETVNSENGDVFTQTIHPVCFINENSFCDAIVEITLDKSISFQTSKIIAELNSKGDGMNVILSKTNRNDFKPEFYINSDYTDKALINLNKLFPIWIENETDEVKSIELVNDISDYKDLPEGIKCWIDSNTTSYKMLLTDIESRGSYKGLDIVKLYSENTSQITQIINIVDYTNPELPATLPIITQSYFSAIQFNSRLISMGKDGYKVFDLIREVDGFTEQQKDSIDTESESIPVKTKIINKRKLTINILPKTKYALVCRLY